MSEHLHVVELHAISLLPLNLLLHLVVVDFLLLALRHLLIDALVVLIILILPLALQLLLVGVLGLSFLLLMYFLLLHAHRLLGVILVEAHLYLGHELALVLGLSLSFLAGTLVRHYAVGGVLLRG